MTCESNGGHFERKVCIIAQYDKIRYRKVPKQKIQEQVNGSFLGVKRKEKNPQELTIGTRKAEGLA